MDPRKICLLGYIFLIVVNLSLSHPLEELPRRGYTPELPKDWKDSARLEERCKKIDEKTLIILCRTQCKRKVRDEFTDISGIDNETWVTSEVAFSKNPNRCKCCETQTSITEIGTKEALLLESTTDLSLDFANESLSNLTDHYIITCDFGDFDIDDYRWNRLDQLFTISYSPGVIFLLATFIIVGLCLCCRVNYRKPITTRDSIPSYQDSAGTTKQV